jgi:hypothetical protein
MADVVFGSLFESQAGSARYLLRPQQRTNIRHRGTSALCQEPKCGITRLSRRSDGGVHPCATEFFVSDQAREHVRRNELPKLLRRGPAALLGPSLIQLTGNRQSWSQPSLDSGSGGSHREPTECHSEPNVETIWVTLSINDRVRDPRATLCVGISTQDGPEERAGEISLQLASRSKSLTARLIF